MQICTRAFASNGFDADRNRSIEVGVVVVVGGRGHGDGGRATPRVCRQQAGLAEGAPSVVRSIQPGINALRGANGGNIEVVRSGEARSIYGDKLLTFLTTLRAESMRPTSCWVLRSCLPFRARRADT